MYGKNRVNNEINNINADKEEDVNIYVNKYINIVNDKIYFANKVSELIDELMGGIDENTSNDIAVKKLKNLKNWLIILIHILKLILKITPNQIVKIILKRKILKITSNQILKITANQILKITSNQIVKIILKIILKIIANQILKITPYQIVKMTSNGILIILGHL